MIADGEPLESKNEASEKHASRRAVLTGR